MVNKRDHILSVEQFDIDDLSRLFKLAQAMERYARREKVTRVLEGAVLANLFFEPSTRSRVSFGSAFARLGGTVLDTTGVQFSSMAKGESISDTSRVISGYVDCIVVRHPVEGSVGEFASAAKVPVINGGDGPGEHPTQALLDVYTICKEMGCDVHGLNGLRITLLGDLKFGRTVHSLSKILSKLKDIQFKFVAPPDLQMPRPIMEILKSRGHNVVLSDSLHDAIQGADIVYCTRIQQERFTSEEEVAKYRGIYRLNAHIVKQYCTASTVLMHPLPRDSRPDADELSFDLNDDSRLAVFRQTDNGIPIRMALFATILGVDHLIGLDDRDAQWLSNL